jgi:hypothetical protein
MAARNPYSAASSLLAAQKAHYAATPFTGEAKKAKRTAMPAPAAATPVAAPMITAAFQA